MVKVPSLTPQERENRQAAKEGRAPRLIVRPDPPPAPPPKRRWWPTEGHGYQPHALPGSTDGPPRNPPNQGSSAMPSRGIPRSVEIQMPDPPPIRINAIDDEVAIARILSPEAITKVYRDLVGLKLEREERWKESAGRCIYLYGDRWLWLKGLIRDAAKPINEHLWNLDISSGSTVDVPAFARYEKGDYLDWHADSREDSEDDDIRRRTLAVVLLLHSAGEGGNLVFSYRGRLVHKVVPPGTALIFPTAMQHCLTEIERGHRDTLIYFMSRAKEEEA